MVETGIYVRILRDEGDYAAVDVGEMSQMELKRWTSDFDAVEGVQWTLGLVKWIQENVGTAPTGSVEPKGEP